MGILDNIEPNTYNKPCKFGRLFNDLDPDDQRILADALEDKTKWTNRQLTLAHNERGLAFTVETLRSHRLNLCGCRRLG